MMECVQHCVNPMQLCAERLSIDFIVINPVMVNVSSTGNGGIILAGGVAPDYAMLLLITVFIAE